jgi:DnaD/phage-associated family protein
VIDMKKSQAGNSILPNTFQHPNIFIDRLMYFLTPEENTVLTFAIRRILGFQENISSRKDNISLSQFVEGIRSSKNDARLSYGCGLGTSAVRNALDNLERYKILLPTTEKPDPRKGQEYWLQENEDSIDWMGLVERRDATDEKARKQTEKARYSVQQKASDGQHTSVEQKAKESVEQQGRVLPDSNTKPTETHQNPQEEEERNPLFSFYENKIGALTPIMADAIEKAEKIFSPKWVADAIELASSNGARHWNYCEAVLKRWKQDGRAERPGKKQTVAQSGDYSKYITSEYADLLEH